MRHRMKRWTAALLAMAIAFTMAPAHAAEEGGQETVPLTEGTAPLAEEEITGAYATWEGAQTLQSGQTASVPLSTYNSDHTAQQV